MVSKLNFWFCPPIRGQTFAILKLPDTKQLTSLLPHTKHAAALLNPLLMFYDCQVLCQLWQSSRWRVSAVANTKIDGTWCTWADIVNAESQLCFAWYLG